MYNYIQKHKNSQMMQQAMKPDINDLSLHTWDNVLTMDQREYLKKLANIAEQQGQIEVSIFLKDVAHWLRYNDKHPDDVKTFAEYVERKYGQEVENINKLRTY